MSFFCKPSTRRMMYEKYLLDWRWQRLWMILVIIVLGPIIFLAGMKTGYRLAPHQEGDPSLNPTKINTGDSSSSGGNQSDIQVPRYLLMRNNEILKSTDSAICVLSGSVCLSVQSDGELMLVEDDKRIWSSQVQLAEGDYFSKLQGDGNLVTRFGEPESGEQPVVWDSQTTTVDSNNYELMWDPSERGMQIVRLLDDGETVVIWTSASTWMNAVDIEEDGLFFEDATDPPNDDYLGLSAEPTPSGILPLPSTTPVLLPAQVPVLSPARVPSSAPLPTAAPVPPPTRPLDPSFATPWSSQYSLRSGPLVGHVTDHSVRLWALQGEGRSMQLVYRAVGTTTTSTINMPANADQGASMLQVIGLFPDMQYEYQIRIEGETVGEGLWKTASPQNQPTQFSFLLASCMDVSSNRYPRQPVWNAALEQAAPDFAILNGDTVYLKDNDWTADQTVILERVWQRNLAQRGEVNFQKFVSRVPTIAVWDDHDYGINNSGSEQKGKYNSLRAFSNLWPNPVAGTPTVEGMFFSFYRGDVHFIVCDNRWHRVKGSGSQFGQAQMRWVENELRSSVGVFKIIVAGGDVMERGMSRDADEIGRIVSSYRISGVLFCAGDIHRNEFKTMDHGNWPYKITQITSSGIAREWRRPWANIQVDTTVSDPYVRAHFFGARSISESTTWYNDPSLTCTSVPDGDRVGEHSCTETIWLSDLQA